MTNLEILLGDALFTVEIDPVNLHLMKQWSDTAHFHVDNEIHVILNGKALVEIDGKDVEMKAGDVCLLAPRSSHYPKNFSDPFEKMDFSFNLTHSYTHVRDGKHFSEYAYYRSIFNSVDEFFIVNDTDLLDILQKLVSEQYSSENDHVCKALLSMFFILLAKRIKERHLPYKDKKYVGVSENENSFRQRKIVEEFFQTKYGQSVSIKDLAEALCLSVPHTHRVVKRIFNEGFQKTLTRQRIEHACMLIKQRDLPLSEIAYRCGYTSYNGFLSAFKSYLGKTPKEYEKYVR